MKNNTLDTTSTLGTFGTFELSEGLLKSIDVLGYKSPTPVQEKVIPNFMKKRDIIVKSKTGSGKTAAFGIPLCQMIDWNENKPQALVIAPTRELALQVREDIFNLGRFERLKVTAVYGKSPFSKQAKELKQRTHVVVGTPGRIIDHLERGTLDPSMIEYLVIDEADEMLRMGFVDQVEEIVKKIKRERTTVVLSATLPRDIELLCANYMKNPLMVEIEEEGISTSHIRQEYYVASVNEKQALLKDVLVVENPDSCMIFCNTQVMVDEVHTLLTDADCACEKIHGGMEQEDRLKVMDHFRKGQFRYLVATDVAARGIDIDHISVVVNYDLPTAQESYIHRIGRTGRIGNTGHAISFSTPNERKLLDEIHRYIGMELTLKERPERDFVSSLRTKFLKKMTTKPDLKITKGDKLNEGIMKLHVNAGKKTKMRNGDIVGTLCSIEGITADDIGIINIVDISTFFEILNGKGPHVLKVLQTKEIKGRLRKVTRAEI